jgi:CubicO group peptidase (beta-lactamase class C family)
LAVFFDFLSDATPKFGNLAIWEPIANPKPLTMKRISIFLIGFLLVISTFASNNFPVISTAAPSESLVNSQAAPSESPVISTTASGDLEHRLDSVMNLFHGHNNFSGSVLVAQDGEVLFSGGYGHASIAHGIPNNETTKFRIASITKQFTSMLVMQMVAEGQMQLEDPIRAYIPDYPAPQGDIVTIHHLLSHTSGFQHYAGIPDFFPLYGRKAFGHREFVELFWELDLLYEPGSEYSYSSFGYYLLGYILEEVAGKPFERLLQERILDPLGMTDTGIVDHREIVLNKATGYDFLLDGLVLAEFRDLSTALATGDMYTTPLDMVKWDQALSEHKLLEKQYQDKIFTPNLSGYGYGWNVGYRPLAEGDSIWYAQHTGGTNGFTSISTRLPGEGYYILVFCNTRPGEIRPIEQAIVSLLYGLDYSFRPSAAIAAARILEVGGLEQAVQFLKNAAAEQAAESGSASDSASGRTPRTGSERTSGKPIYVVTLGDIDRIGTDLLRLEHHNQALAFLELGVELFPESVQALVMLGDGFHQAGMEELAVYNYARALMLNPNHKGALERIQRY